MISVVVPTHNRSASAVKLARVIDDQECPSPLEIVFVADGCADGTKERLEALPLKRELRIVELDGQGAAAARNAGVETARGELIIFIDDDVMPLPGMIAAHAVAGANQDLAFVGPYPYAPDWPVGALDFFARDWWHMRFKSLADPTHIRTYRDCLTGNMSIRRDAFLALGGFDQAFKGAAREDYEFGQRWLKQGKRMEFLPEAKAYHYPVSRPEAFLRKWHTIGRADVRFARKHPEVFDTLPLRRFCRRHGFSQRVLRDLAACTHPASLRVLSMLGKHFERNVDALWNRRVLAMWGKIQHYAYFSGAMAELGGLKELDEFLRSHMPKSEWPRSSMQVRDVFVADRTASTGGEAAADELFILPRVGTTVVGWVRAPLPWGQDSVSAAETAERIASGVAWEIWREEFWPDSPLADEIDDKAARLRLRGSIGRVMPALGVENGKRVSQEGCTTSALVFCGENEIPSVEIEQTFRDGKVIRIKCAESGLRSRLAAALSECTGDVVAFLSPSDRPDIGWADGIARLFRGHSRAFAVSPVVRRSVKRRGEDLLNTAAGFERITSQVPHCVSERMSPSRILVEFGPLRHRLVVGREAALGALADMSTASVCCEQATIRIMCALLAEKVPVIYATNALIWDQSETSMADARRLVLDNSRRAFRIAAASCHGIDMCGLMMAGCRLVAKRIIRHARGKDDWPPSLALGELLSAICGFAEGLHGHKGVEKEPPVDVRESEGITWVS